MRKGIISIFSLMTGALVGSVVGAVVVFRKEQKEKAQWREMANKHLTLMLLFNQWLIVKQERKSIIDYFNKKDITCIAIYGMSYVGERLLKELKDSDIEVKYAIDVNANSIYTDIDVFLPNQYLPKVDAVVVTAVSSFYDIREMLLKKVNCEIISFEDILDEL